MEIFREWIQNIVVFLLLMTMAGQLIPDEKYKKYIQNIKKVVILEFWGEQLVNTHILTRMIVLTRLLR